MKASELRLGNYIRCNDVQASPYFKLEEGHFISIMKSPKSCFDWVEPILLTDEWLLRFGFENWGIVEVNKYEHYHRWVLHNAIDGTSNFEVHIVFSHYEAEKYCEIVYSIDQSDRMHFIKNTDYVHTLQNTFALTGQELKIK